MPVFEDRHSACALLADTARTQGIGEPYCVVVEDGSLRDPVQPGVANNNLAGPAAAVITLVVARHQGAPAGPHRVPGNALYGSGANRVPCIVTSRHTPPVE